MALAAKGVRLHQEEDSHRLADRVVAVLFQEVRVDPVQRIFPAAAAVVFSAVVLVVPEEVAVMALTAPAVEVASETASRHQEVQGDPLVEELGDQTQQQLSVEREPVEEVAAVVLQPEIKRKAAPEDHQVEVAAAVEASP